MKRELKLTKALLLRLTFIPTWTVLTVATPLYIHFHMWHHDWHKRTMVMQLLIVCRIQMTFLAGIMQFSTRFGSSKVIYGLTKYGIVIGQNPWERTLVSRQIPDSMDLVGNNLLWVCNTQIKVYQVVHRLHLGCALNEKWVPPIPHLHHSKSPHVHLTCIFSPHVHILTSHAPLHLHCSKSPCIHLVYIFSPHIHILTSRAPLHPK